MVNDEICLNGGFQNDAQRKSIADGGEVAFRPPGGGDE